MKIIKYKNANNIDILFIDDGYISKNRTYDEFQKGGIRNPYVPTVCNVGYIGEGIYKSIYKNKKTKIYQVWQSMLQRCYDNKLQEKYISYVDCTVCDEWHNFQNFAEWFEENYYEIENEIMQLDKDILIKGNKIYSPDTCIFVPQSINELFTKRKNHRGKYPIGVRCDKKTKKFVSQCHTGKKSQEYLGFFNTELEAFKAYKEFKESYIKQVADEYKEKIPEKLYNAMYNYKVEIDD